MKKIITFLGATVLMTTSGTITACGNNSTNNNLINLNTKISNRHLGAIVMKDNVPNQTEILTAIKANNPAANSLTENDFAFSQQSIVTATKATIVGINNYQGEVTLQYQRESHLDKYITSRDLSNIYIGNQSLSLADIKIKNALKLNGINPYLNLNKIKVANISHAFFNDTAQIISTDENFYTGQVEITFLPSNFIKISGITGIGEKVEDFVVDKDGNTYVRTEVNSFMINNKQEINFYKCEAGQNVFTLMTTIKADISDAQRSEPTPHLMADYLGNIYFLLDYNNCCKVYKCEAGQTNFNEITEIDNTIQQITFDQNNNLYAWTYWGNIYKCEAGQTNFYKMNITADELNTKDFHLITDQKNNVYAYCVGNSERTISNIYKCEAGQTNFNKIANFNFGIDDLKIDHNNNLYLKSNGNSKIYKCQADQTNFNELTGITKRVKTFTIAANGELYATGKDDNLLYKCLPEETEFKQLADFNLSSFSSYSDTTANLAVDKSGNIFIKAINKNGWWRIFKCQAGENVFEQMLTSDITIDTNISLLIDNDDIVYISSENTLYKSEKLV